MITQNNVKLEDKDVKFVLGELYYTVSGAMKMMDCGSDKGIVEIYIFSLGLFRFSLFLRSFGRNPLFNCFRACFVLFLGFIPSYPVLHLFNRKVHTLVHT